MMIIGCDYHPSWQQIAWLDTETGETGERKLVHASGEAQQFYRQLAAPALIGMEATGNSQWFIELVEDLGHAIWIGDAAQIRASYVRKQKTDKRDAAHMLMLGVEGRFPRLWTPDRKQRDLRQLVLHRHKLVEICKAAGQTSLAATSSYLPRLLNIILGCQRGESKLGISGRHFLLRGDRCAEKSQDGGYVAAAPRQLRGRSCNAPLAHRLIGL